MVAYRYLNKKFNSENLLILIMHEQFAANFL